MKERGQILFLGSKSQCVLILVLYVEFCFLFSTYYARKKTELNFYLQQRYAVEKMIEEKNQKVLTQFSSRTSIGDF